MVVTLELISSPHCGHLLQNSRKFFITVTRPISHIFRFVLDSTGTRLAGSDPLPSFSIGLRLNDRVRICTIFLTSQGLAKEHMAYGIHSPRSWSGGHSNTLHECPHLLRRNASKHLGSAEPMPPVPYVRIDDNHSRRTTITRGSWVRPLDS